MQKELFQTIAQVYEIIALDNAVVELADALDKAFGFLALRLGEYLLPD